MSNGRFSSERLLASLLAKGWQLAMKDLAAVRCAGGSLLIAHAEVMGRGGLFFPLRLSGEGAPFLLTAGAWVWYTAMHGAGSYLYPVCVQAWP
jgi:hypothetical protein